MDSFFRKVADATLAYGKNIRANGKNLFFVICTVSGSLLVGYSLKQFVDRVVSETSREASTALVTEVEPSVTINTNPLAPNEEELEPTKTSEVLEETKQYSDPKINSENESDEGSGSANG